jgi:hypothetical protein
MYPQKWRILIDDAVVPDLLGSENIRFFNLLDIHMTMILNAKERTRKQWETLSKPRTNGWWLGKSGRRRRPGGQGGKVLELRLKG